jgi:hypothetical protein
MEGKDLDGRQWVVRRDVQFVQHQRISTLGRLRLEAHRDGERVISDWIIHKIVAPSGSIAEAHIDTLPLPTEERARKHREYVVGGLVGNAFIAGAMPASDLVPAVALTAHLGDLELNRQIYIPEAEASWRNLIKFEPPHPEVGESIQESIRPKLMQRGAMLPLAGADRDMSSGCEILPDQIQVRYGISVTLPAPLNYTSRATVVAVCTNRELVKRMETLKSGPWDPKAPLEIDPAPVLLLQYQRDWYISKVIVDLAKFTGGGRNKPGPEMMQDQPPPRR